MLIKYFCCNIFFFIIRFNLVKFKRGIGDIWDCKGMLRIFYGVIYDVKIVKFVLGVLGKCSESYGDF